MGTTARVALKRADGIEYAGGLARRADPAEGVFDDVDTLCAERAPDVLLDWTTYPSSVDISMRALRNGVRPVVGATGWSDFDRQALEREASERRIGAMLVPNFSLGAALMVGFASHAARFFPSVEIVELHHDRKKDKPSGTALLTAERIAATGRFTTVPTHSVRLRGLVAHQEVLFGDEGELLTVRHDCFSRAAYVSGMIAAVRRVVALTSLAVGLDAVLESAEPST